MEEEKVKYVDINAHPKGAYVSLNLIKQPDGRAIGKWYLDSKAGWWWNGDEGDFLLGLMRVSPLLYEGELKEEFDENLSKDDVLSALLTSIEIDPLDGVYNAIGDNAFFMNDLDIYEEHVEEWFTEMLKDLGVDEDFAKFLSDEAISKISVSDDDWIKMVSQYPKNIFPNAGEKTRWNQLVEKVAFDCSKETEKPSDFALCVTEKLNPDPEDKFDFVEDVLTNETYESLCDLITDRDSWEEIVSEYMHYDGELSPDVLEHYRREIASRICNMTIDTL